MTIVQIAVEVGLSVGTVHAILKEDFGMHRVGTKLFLDGFWMINGMQEDHCR
jgi:hypothetical protein